jgi:acyl-CoA dehydrogenase
VLGGHLHLKAALKGDAPRRALARFYIHSLLPEHTGLLVQAREGAGRRAGPVTPDDLAA